MALENDQYHLDLIFDALSDQRRRFVIAYMHTSDKDHFTFDDLVQVIDCQLTEATELTDTQREGMRLSLHHRHLPKLEDAGLIEYDHRNGDVRYRGAIDREVIDVSTLLDAIEVTTHTIDQPI